MTIATPAHPAADHAPAQLPDGWRLARLSDVCELNPRRPNLNGRPDDAPTTFVPMQAVGEREGAIIAPEVRPFREVANGYTYFAEGDVLFAKITPCMQNGKHAVARGLTDGIGFGSTEFHVIRPGPNITAEWVWYYVRQPWVLRDATRYFTGAVGQQRVPDDFLSRLRLPLPPLAEQRRIVAVLSEKLAAVEKARAAAEARLLAAKALRAAFLREVFPRPGQPLSPGWRWVRLRDITCVVSGTTPDSGRAELWNGEVVWVTPTDLGMLQSADIWDSARHVTAAAVDMYGLQIVPPETVVMSSRAPIGHLGIARVPLCTNQGCKSFVPGPNVDSSFLYYTLLWHIDEIQAMGSGATFAEVSKSQLEVFRITLPPLAEQRRIVGALTERMAVADRIRAAAEEELRAIEALRPAYLRLAFQGGL